jgi:serine/threonine protein kinase
VIDSNGNAVLADFGLSIALANGDRSYYNSYSIGAVRWLAPEVGGIDDENIEINVIPRPTRESDIFSLGCIMLEVSPVCQTLVEFHLRLALDRSSRVNFPFGGRGLFNRSSALGIII